MKRRIALTLGVLMFGAAAVARLRASEEHGQFRSRVFGSQPLVTVRGFPSGGAPWVAGPSWALLAPNGDAAVRIRGLVLASGVTAAGGTVAPAAVGTNPVSTVRITVTWMVPNPGAPVVFRDSPPMHLDAGGNLDARFNVGPPPAGAERPIILVRAGASGITPFIAETNFLEDFGAARPLEDD